MALLILLIMLFFVTIPTNAKQVHQRTYVLRGIQIKSPHYYHNKHKYHKHYRKRKRTRYKKHKIQKTQFSKRDFDDINNDRQSNNLPALSNNSSLQKIAIDRATLAFKAWNNGWNSHGTDGKTTTAAQLGFNVASNDYDPCIRLISENNARSHISNTPATSSMVDGRMNHFAPEDVSTPTNIINTNNDIYMNHDVGANGQSSHRTNILDNEINSVGTAVYHKNGVYVQDEVFGYIEN